MCGTQHWTSTLERETSAGGQGGLDLTGDGTADLFLLQTLYCYNTKVADLGPLAACKSLRSLDCHKTSVADLGPLAACTGLADLTYDHHGHESDEQIRLLRAACHNLQAHVP